MADQKLFQPVPHGGAVLWTALNACEHLSCNQGVFDRRARAPKKFSRCGDFQNIARAGIQDAEQVVMGRADIAGVRRLADP